jgi:nickel/cobalt tolerance cation efflux system protein
MATNTDKGIKPINRPSISHRTIQKSKHRQSIITVLLIIPLVIFLWLEIKEKQNVLELNVPPLVMSQGDPYIRALMRTISAAESNTSKPYIALYGGKHFHDLSRHPNQCIPIVTGPNRGKCTTAAGRYQFLTQTWLLKAQKYHPQGFRKRWSSYRFDPEAQDRVVYSWLKDSHAWGTDIPTLLRQGEIERVLKRLSQTWTSLGYGIEDNSMTPYLTEIYQKLLSEELAQTDSLQ